MMTKIRIKGMHCSSCVHMVEIILKNTKGVEDVLVNLEDGVAILKLEHPINKRVLNQELESAGYTAEY